MICSCGKTKIPDHPGNDPTKICVCTNCNTAYQYVRSRSKDGEIFYDPVPIIGVRNE